MSPEPLDVRILRKGRKEDEQQLTADPADLSRLSAYLRGWLEGHKWDKGLWGQFELEVRRHGRGKVVVKVRA